MINLPRDIGNPVEWPFWMCRKKFLAVTAHASRIATKLLPVDDPMQRGLISPRRELCSDGNRNKPSPGLELVTRFTFEPACLRVLS